MTQKNKDENRTNFFTAVENADSQIKKALYEYVNGGYLKNIALILSYLEKNSEATNAILAGFTSDQKKKIESFMETETDEGKKLSAAATVINNDPSACDEAVQNALKLHCSVDSKVYAETVEKLMATNPLLGIILNKNSFLFEDLVYLDDRAIQKVLRDVDCQHLAMAMKNTTQDVIDKVTRNMSRRAASMILEDMEFMGPVRISDVEDAQEQIIRIIKKLIEKGEVIMPGDCEMV